MNDSCLHIGVLVERRYLTQLQPTGMITALEARGHKVTLIKSQAVSLHLTEQKWLHGLDMIVVRGRSWPLLCLLTLAETLGIPTINRRAGVTAVLNKAEVVMALSTAKLRMPQSFLGPTKFLKNKIPIENYPIILKPLFGDNCQGLRVVNRPEILEKMKWAEPVAFAQQYLPNDGHDLKLYGIGDQIWAVHKPSPLCIPSTVYSYKNQEHDSKAKLLKVTRGFQKLAYVCRNLFNLDFFGVDCICTRHGPVIVDVNEFPNYTGVPDADQKLAEYVIQSVKQGRRKKT